MFLNRLNYEHHCLKTLFLSLPLPRFLRNRYYLSTTINSSDKISLPEDVPPNSLILSYCKFNYPFLQLSCLVMLRVNHFALHKLFIPLTSAVFYSYFYHILPKIFQWVFFLNHLSSTSLAWSKLLLISHFIIQNWLLKSFP